MERCGNSQNDVEYFHTRRLFDAVQMQFVVERLAIDPQQPGRLGFVAAGRRQRPPDPHELCADAGAGELQGDPLQVHIGVLGCEDVCFKTVRIRFGRFFYRRKT